MFCQGDFIEGLPTVPAVFIDGANYAEIALVENLLRQDLTPVEEAEALQRLLDLRACQQDDLAELIGKSKATISESLSLNRLPQAIRDACRQDPTVPKNVLVVIAFPSFPLSLLLRRGPDHADRIHERPEGHPGAGHHPGGEEQEKTGLKTKAARVTLLIKSYI